MKGMRATLFVVLTVIAAACENGGSVPTTPGVVTPPVATTLRATVPAVDGLTGKPVMGVSVTGVSAQVVGEKVTIDVSSGTLITLSAAGYASYKTAWVARENFVMWPIAGHNSEQIVREQIYGVDGPGLFNPGVRSAVRLNGPLTFVVPADMPSANVQQWKRMAAKLQQVNGYAASVEFAPQAGTANFEVVLNTNIGPPAQTMRYESGGVITGGRIELQRWDITDFTVGHEMGHASGWSHHSGQGLMGVAYGWVEAEFSPAERDNGMMLVRIRPQTQEVYDDGGILSPNANTSSTRSLGVTKVVISETGWKFDR